jgi:hypothetical protein
MKLKVKLSKNWIAKLLSLLLATVIWFLIKDTLKSSGGFAEPPPRAIPVR